MIYSDTLFHTTLAMEPRIWFSLFALLAWLLSCASAMHTSSCIDRNEPLLSSLIDRVNTEWDIQENSTTVSVCAMFTGPLVDLQRVRSVSIVTEHRIVTELQFFDGQYGKHFCPPAFSRPKSTFRVYAKDFADRIVDCTYVSL
jgi:hypothetical protein